MPNSRKKWILPLAGIAVIFTAITLIMLRLMPGPHTAADYLVVGGLATLVSLVLLFALLIGMSPGTFGKRR
jgi:hypothetical protein